ncbi:anaphase-promoting complex subunit 5-like [Lotus japonicus]|uniref:anaphase-promoting complex subunit 5-like n=1 Tax=Lotus japonicus TaxID=34305 RepID=UPI00258668FB|nr:anaphase-promoting complex subunit 5-like [Lotus japonicus]
MHASSCKVLVKWIREVTFTLYIGISSWIYCKEFSNCPPYEEPSLDDSSSNIETYLEYDNADLENFVCEKVSEEIDARKEASERVLFHLHMPDTLLSFVDDVHVPADSVSKQSEKFRIDSPYGDPPFPSNWQIHGFIQEQADSIPLKSESGGSVSLNGFETILQQLQKLAPELQQVSSGVLLQSPFLRDYDENEIFCLYLYPGNSLDRKSFEERSNSSDTWMAIHLQAETLSAAIHYLPFKSEFRPHIQLSTFKVEGETRYVLEPLY